MTARLPYLTALSALSAFAVYQVLGMVWNGGVFEYPLDDVYIHLAMAEQLYAGGYGVNMGEVASAASSPLYPALLPTWAGLGVQKWLPLFWNAIAIVIAAALLGAAIAKAELGRAGAVIAIAAPVALAMHVTAFSGMENMAHGAASLAIVIGLWRFAETSRVGALLLIGVVLAPAFRLEGLALALAAAGVVALFGRPLAGAMLAALGLAPVLLFSAALTSLGLDPLPNSVNAKLAGGGGGLSSLLSVGDTIRFNIGTYGGRYLAALTVLVALVAMAARGRGATRQAAVGLAVVATAVAHLALASTGWMDRYENYLILALFAVLALLLASFGMTVRIAALGAALLGGAATYGPYFDNYLWNPRAIHLQQGQMARFAKEHLRAPVAVNDIGYPTWNSSVYVLDLWGLASAEALALRKSDAPDGWADELADAKGVRVAMIYDRVLKDALGPDWEPLGQLVLLDAGTPFLGGVAVSFYARNGAEADAVQADLRDWASGLPDGATFVFAERGGTS